MLNSVTIRNLALFEEIDIQFTGGFNILLGETGAGKSLLLKALGLIRGQKFDPNLIRDQSKEAAVIAEFFVDAKNNQALSKKIETLNLPMDANLEDLRIIIRRSCKTSGRSVYHLNDIPVSGQTVLELTDFLFIIASQHESVSLLNPSTHLEIIDSYAPTRLIRQKFKEQFALCQEIIKELEQHVELSKSGAIEIDFLRYQLKEIDELNPQDDDYQNILQVQTKGALNASLLSGLRGCSEIFEENSQSISFHDQLGRGVRGLEECLRKTENFDPEIQDIAARLNNLRAEIDDLSYLIAGKVSKLESNGQEVDMEFLQNRLGLYKHLLKKHQCQSVEELLEKRKDINEHISAIEFSEKFITKIVDRLLSATEDLKKKADSLSQERRVSADKISRSMEKILKDLYLPNANIEVMFSSINKQPKKMDLSRFSSELQTKCDMLFETLSNYDVKGQEIAVIFFSANQGERPGPLERSASGGELSRILLAIKELCMERDSSVQATMIFDELDSGVSGRVADAVGKKMRALAKSSQIICVSHQAQVAACAHSHYLVSKLSKGGKTSVSVKAIADDELAHAMAAMVSGEKVSDTGVQHAKVLIAEAKLSKKKAKGLVSPLN